MLRIEHAKQKEKNKMNLDTMTGLEIVQAFASGQLAMPTILQSMPIKILDVEHGRVVFEVMPNQQHCDFLGKIHNGYAATILDAVTACATRTILEVGQSYDTLDLNLKICQALVSQKKLIAEAKIVNRGRRLIIAEGSLKDEQGTLYAYVTTNQMIVKSEIKST